MRRSAWLSFVVLVAALVPQATPAHAAVPGTLVFTVFASAKADAGVYLLSASGGTPAKTAAMDRGYRPRWAPDGSVVAYLGPFGSIRCVDADGTNDRLLLRRKALPSHFPNVALISWSPDGARLLLTLRSRGYRYSRLYIADLATERVRLLARGAGDGDWSSTGRIVATRLGNVVTMDVDGTNRTIIYRKDARWLRWSPDGSALVFMHGDSDILVMGADGSDPTNLTTSKAYDWSPDWSPDGTMIVWSRSASFETPADLFEMQADGTGVVRLTSTTDLDEYEPNWTA